MNLFSTPIKLLTSGLHCAFLLKKYIFCHYRQVMICLSCCHTQTGNGEGVHKLNDMVISILVAVVGGVICHYIIKWLDGDKHDN